MPKVEVFVVDSGIPIPESKQRIPLHTLEVGESFLFPLDKRQSIQTTASRLKKLENKEYTIKKMDSENCRVWRTK